MFDALKGFVVDVVDALGYAGVALLVLVENVFPPIPSEVVLALAGFVASEGRATVPGMIAAATAGSVGGALVLYAGAASYGPVRLRQMVVTHQRWTRITERDLDRAEAWFDRWSTLAVLICRCVPLVRSLISIPAGLRRMSLVSFLLYTTAGSLVWNTIFVLSGFLLAEEWERVVSAADYAEYLVLVAIALAAVALGLIWFRRGRRPAR